MNTRFFLLMILTSLFLVTACADEELDPNEVTNNQLEGDWDVESFTVDGVEQMNFTINVFDMEFEKQGPFDGETEWTLIGTNGSTQRIDGDYQIENSGTEIDVDGDELDIDIDGDDLDLEGNVDGARWIIKAERD